MAKKKQRVRSHKQAKEDLHDEEEQQQQHHHLQNPKMVEEEEQPSEPAQQGQSPEDQNPESMEEDPPSQTHTDQNLEHPSRASSIEEEEETDQNPQLMLVEEEPPPPPPLQDQSHDVDGTHDLENPPREDQAPEEIHNLENLCPDSIVRPEVEKIDEEEEEHQQQLDQKEEEHQQQQIHHQLEDDVTEPEGMMDLSPTLPPPPPAHEITLLPPHKPPSVSRKTSKRKKHINKRQLAALEKKLQVVKEKLQPIPFIPNKTLDFTKHEKILKRLGLWDFAHLGFDREIRMDLLAQLIANFNPQNRCSFVNGFRIMVNRADLGRALKLPLKKDKINQLESVDSDVEKLPEDSVSFIEDFLSSWFFLNEETLILPNEIVAWCKLIRDGQPEKVDWPGLIWLLVEKEITQSPQLGLLCYYASHLQCLIKAQHADLFKEEPPTTEEVYMKEEENLDDFQGEGMELQQIELSLGHVKTDCEQVRDVMDFQDCKDDEPGIWRLDVGNSVGGHFLERCNQNEVRGLGIEQEERYDLSSKPTSLERLSSTELIQAMGTANLFSHSSRELLTSRIDNNMNSVGPSVFGNGCSRTELDHDDDDDVDHHRSFNDQHKRMRSDGLWDFEFCMEQVQSWMGKARLMYVAKQQEMMNIQLHQEALNSELEQQNKIIETLQRSKSEEEQKRRLENYRLDRECYVMSNLLNGYKKALKETRQAFSEYKQCYSQPEEPLYKDVAGSGGLVLSSMELEKQRKEQEEELRVKRIMIEEQFRNFEQRWFEKLELHKKEVHLLGNRLFDLENGTKLLKESFVKREVSET